MPEYLYTFRFIVRLLEEMRQLNSISNNWKVIDIDRQTRTRTYLIDFTDTSTNPNT